MLIWASLDESSATTTIVIAFRGILKATRMILETPRVILETTGTLRLKTAGMIVEMTTSFGSIEMARQVTGTIRHVEIATARIGSSVQVSGRRRGGSTSVQVCGCRRWWWATPAARGRLLHRWPGGRGRSNGAARRFDVTCGLFVRLRTRRPPATHATVGWWLFHFIVPRSFLAGQVQRVGHRTLCLVFGGALLLALASSFLLLLPLPLFAFLKFEFLQFSLFFAFHFSLSLEIEGALIQLFFFLVHLVNLLLFLGLAAADAVAEASKNKDDHANCQEPTRHTGGNVNVLHINAAQLISDTFLFLIIVVIIIGPSIGFIFKGRWWFQAADIQHMIDRGKVLKVGLSVVGLDISRQSQVVLESQWIFRGAVVGKDAINVTLELFRRIRGKLGRNQGARQLEAVGLQSSRFAAGSQTSLSSRGDNLFLNGEFVHARQRGVQMSRQKLHGVRRDKGQLDRVQ
mmetsp:Transcript_19090/g.52345  ORF Transcript_19090/g.52345 Transcript_19090/m.52345 type:complete len:459 (-) Transcript_19090:1415-2791(-)